MNGTKMCFGDQVFDVLDSSASKNGTHLNDYIDVLKDCITKLPEKDAYLLKLRYEGEMTFKNISLDVGKTAPTVHRLMALIHSKLALCVRRTLYIEEAL